MRGTRRYNARMDLIRPDGPDVLIQVKVVPGASRSRIVGPLGDRLKVAVAAPPEKGRANAELEALLAKLCGVRTADVTVEAGRSAAAKLVRIRGVDSAKALRALGL